MFTNLKMHKYTFNPVFRSVTRQPTLNRKNLPKFSNRFDGMRTKSVKRKYDAISDSNFTYETSVANFDSNPFNILSIAFNFTNF